MSAGPELENGTAAPITPGKETSEFAQTNGAALMANVLTILGVIGSFGSGISGALGADTKIGVIVGAVVAIAGILSRTLVTLGYTKSRTDIKAGQ